VIIYNPVANLKMLTKKEVAIYDKEFPVDNSIVIPWIPDEIRKQYESYEDIQKTYMCDEKLQQFVEEKKNYIYLGTHKIKEKVYIDFYISNDNFYGVTYSLNNNGFFVLGLHIVEFDKTEVV
jgi:hypothetical protein